MFLKRAQVHSKTVVFYSIIYLILKIKNLEIMQVNEIGHQIFREEISLCYK